MNRKRIEKILHNCSKTIDESVNMVGASNEIVKYIEDLEQQCKKQKELIDKKSTQQKEFIKYLEDEKDRLARECSNIYEDGLGRTRLVNEDIFDEIDTILSKYRSIIGDKE